MLTWIKIAIRNLIKNRRRSFFTVLAIGIGFAAVNIFGGFTEYIFDNLKDSFIYAQGNGHLTIFKQGFTTQGSVDPFKFLLTDEDVKTIREVCQSDPNVSVVTPQLQIMGLVTNGQISTIFMAIGRVPSDYYSIRDQASGMIGRLKLYQGEKLQDDIPYGVGLSTGLARKLKLEPGSDAVAMATTIEGPMNALDLQVLQIFKAPLEELDDKLMAVPLQFAQSLYDTTSVDRMTILLRDDRHLEIEKQRLQQALSQKGLDTDIKVWQELSPFYRKVKDMFDVIFTFVFVIVLIIVVMSVINTVSMSILERTREIGTLRALGLRRAGIVRLFAIESCLLGILGSGFGAVLTLGGWSFVKVLAPTWVPPNIPTRVPLEVYLVPSYLILSLICLLALSMLSALWPARKAARKAIVDALGHV